MVTGTAAVVVIAWTLIGWARFDSFDERPELVDHVGLIMLLGGYAVFAIGAIGLLLIGIDALARGILTRMRKRRAHGLSS